MSGQGRKSAVARRQERSGRGASPTEGTGTGGPNDRCHLPVGVRPGGGWRIDLSARLELAQRPGDGGGIERALGHLDPLVERLLRVPVDDLHLLLGQNRAGVHLERGQVHGAARHAGPGGQGVAHGVPTRESRQEGRVGVEDASREGVVHGLGQQRPEAGHGHQVHLVGDQGRRNDVAVGITVKTGAEAPEVRASDQFCGHTVCRRDIEAGTRSIGEHDRDGKASIEHGLEDRPRS